MRTIDANHEAIYASQSKSVTLRVQIEDGDGTLQDITSFKGTNWVLGVETGMDIDADAADCKIRIKRSVYNDSMAPLNKVTRINKNIAGSWDPILALNHEVVVSVKYGADYNAGHLAYIELFRGAIDTIDWGSDTIEVSCRDQFRELQDTFIEAEAAYSDSLGNPVEDIMQEILDDVLGGAAPTLYTPTTPSWNILEFKVTQQSLADQLLLLSDQIGWRLKYLWDSGTSAFRLTLIEPSRDNVSVHRTFNQEQYYSINSVNVDIAGIRNAIKVTYPDIADLRADGTPKAKSVTAVSATSVTAYGRRWMGVTEAASSIINTSAEATIMAGAMLDDLSLPRVAQTVDMPLFAHVELDDLYTFEANDVHYTYDPAYAVVSFRHYITEGRAYTHMQLREDKAAGKNLAWFQNAGVNGIARKPRSDAAEIADARVTESNLGMQVNWDLAMTGFDAYQDGQLLKDTFFEVHVTESGGTPSSATLVGVTKANSFLIQSEQSGLVPVDELLDVHVRAVSKAGESGYQTVAGKKALAMGTAGLHPDNTVFNEGLSSHFNEQTKGPAFEPDGWSMETGTWATDAALDDGTVYTSVTPRFGDKFLLLK
jgi:hypothetical protein